MILLHGRAPTRLHFQNPRRKRLTRCLWALVSCTVVSMLTTCCRCCSQLPVSGCSQAHPFRHLSHILYRNISALRIFPAM